ncbi:hypothetical protein BOTBODRAFT_180271 [Botryobasidium botryosum FD-172 SS1]|uniref:rRNA-processing protein FYV7 n=1 Tax=Botryobasidium botryosum (strain FD-172 SS1) TaxID=930990 RepID=A0A067M7U1_BOTB1|nr:hypothetical protein BOTBODRAFT_180271 [Botryobasidium botryosum FD-172 SS1]
MAPSKPPRKNANATPLGRPRTGPPKFQHLPLAQARKLKKDWVEKKKIKSAYKAEKRRAGNGVVASAEVATGEGRNNEEVHGDIAEQKSGVDDESGDDDKEHISPPRKQPPVSKLPPKEPHPAWRKPHNPSSSSKHPSPNVATKDQDAEREKRIQLRNLTREAYSQDSLHNYKSDPLGRRRKHQQDTNSGGKGGREQGRGRGQPDMKKRMGVLLARLQMDAGKQ